MNFLHRMIIRNQERNLDRAVYSTCGMLTMMDERKFHFSEDFSIENSSIMSYQSSNWWLSKLEFLNIKLLKKVVKTKIVQKVDNTLISSLLLHYHRTIMRGALHVSDKQIITKAVINLLCSLNTSSVNPRGLFGILRCSLSLKLKKCYIKKLESQIASVLDQATLDDLLIPSPHGELYAYDVNFILRLQKKFILGGSGEVFVQRVKKVAFLMDFYIMEVAPDPHLESSKFVELITLLPDLSRDSHDRIYQAVDLYFKVQSNLEEEDKRKICGALNYDKLSATLLIQLASNLKFPYFPTAIEDVSRHSKLKHLTKKTSYLGDVFRLHRNGTRKNNGYKNQKHGFQKMDIRCRSRMCRSIQKRM